MSCSEVILDFLGNLFMNKYEKTSLQLADNICIVHTEKRFFVLCRILNNLLHVKFSK